MKLGYLKKVKTQLNDYNLVCKEILYNPLDLCEAMVQRKIRVLEE